MPKKFRMTVCVYWSCWNVLPSGFWMVSIQKVAETLVGFAFDTMNGRLLTPPPDVWILVPGGLGSLVGNVGSLTIAWLLSGVVTGPSGEVDTTRVTVLRTTCCCNFCCKARFGLITNSGGKPADKLTGLVYGVM